MPVPNPNPDRDRLWRTYAIPAAQGIEAFFWKLLWFVVIVCSLFSFNPFRTGASHENRTATAGGTEAVPEQPASE